MTASPASSLIDSLAAGVPAGGELAAGREESEWITAARAGDAEAFRRLVGRWGPPLHRFCSHWLRCAEDASEVCQDTFVRAWQALPDWEPRAQFSTWLYRIALNLCRDRARTRQHRQRGSTGSLAVHDDHHACPAPAPDAAAARRGDMERLFRGLELLPDKLRAALVLTALDGLSHRECAAVLRCSERSVEGRVRRARQRLAAWWDA